MMNFVKLICWRRALDFLPKNTTSFTELQHLAHPTKVPDVAATLLRRPEPPEWRVELTTLGATAVELLHSNR